MHIVASVTSNWSYHMYTFEHCRAQLVSAPGRRHLHSARLSRTSYCTLNDDFNGHKTLSVHIIAIDGQQAVRAVVRNPPSRQVCCVVRGVANCTISDNPRLTGWAIHLHKYFVLFMGSLQSHVFKQKKSWLLHCIWFFFSRACYSKILEKL